MSVSNGNGGDDNLSFGAATARYVHLNTIGWKSNTYRNWLNEFEVYASASPSQEPTATNTPVSRPSPTPTAGIANSIHVGDLDASSSISGRRWTATVSITAHDAVEAPVQGVTVYGAWSNGASGSDSCTTGADGMCSINKTRLRNSVGNVTFNISSISFNLPYHSSDNHDPDGDSDGTTISVAKP